MLCSLMEIYTSAVQLQRDRIKTMWNSPEWSDKVDTLTVSQVCILYEVGVKSGMIEEGDK